MKVETKNQASGAAREIDRVLHDMRNSLGAIILNLEIAADAAYAHGVALESAVDALEEARRLKDALPGLRSVLESRS